jgi:hypothetical protein
MRNLNSNDLMTCVAIFGKVGDKLKIEEGTPEAAIGMKFVSSALSFAQSDIKALLADIAEMSIEDFEQQPFDYPITVVEWLFDNEDMKSFFQRVKALTQKF